MREISRRDVLKAGLGVGALAGLVAEGYAIGKLQKDAAITSGQVDEFEQELLTPEGGHIQHHRTLDARTLELNSRMNNIERDKNLKQA